MARRGAAWLLLLLLALQGAGLTTAATAAGRVITDQSGHPVTVPAAPVRIADLWYAHNELLIMLGATRSIAMTPNRPSTSPWMFQVAPDLRRATQLSGTSPNAESLLAQHVDLVFASSGSDAVSAVRRVGIPTFEVGFTDAASLMRCVDLTADVLDTDPARSRARRYDAYLAGVIRNVRAVTDPIAASARPRVLHIQSLSPLKVDGAATLIDDWIRIAGGRNAAAGLSGNMRQVSVEQVAAWNPDIIILGGNAGALDGGHMPGLWHAIRAVHDGKVFRNPAGMFPWDRYGTEFALQLHWAAKAIQPGLFARTDMTDLTRQFYRDFFDYPLRPDEARRILAALPPA